MVLSIAIILLFLGTLVFIIMHQPKFGRLPSGERLERIKRSENYRNGQFQNMNPTPSITEGASYLSVLYQFLFNRNKRKLPPFVLPSYKTDLYSLDPDKNILVWFGHSSYYLQVDGKTILVDPVLSGNASPFNFTTKSFKGSDIYTADEIPDIDYLFITHDHWDHLDYDTVLKLRPRVGSVITGLGTGAHLEHWGYDKQMLIEKDWNEEIILGDGFKVNTVPARHFSGRTLQRNKSLWMSFVFTTPHFKLFIGGDSGYDDHFAGIGAEYGPFDLAILENGQYNKNWKYIHMMPEEVIQAAKDLRSDKLFPVHWSKFTLSLHDWDDSIIRIVKEASEKHITLIHPMIGEAVDLNTVIEFKQWWKKN